MVAGAARHWYLPLFLVVCVLEGLVAVRRRSGAWRERFRHAAAQATRRCFKCQKTLARDFAPRLRPTEPLVVVVLTLRFRVVRAAAALVLLLAALLAGRDARNLVRMCVGKVEHGRRAHRRRRVGDGVGLLGRQTGAQTALGERCEMEVSGCNSECAVREKRHTPDWTVWVERRNGVWGGVADGGGSPIVACP